MTQQLAIMAMIDVAAALETGTLAGNIHLVDNNRWLGSRGEGGEALVSVVRITRVDGVVDAQVLNWLCNGVGVSPADLPPDLSPVSGDGDPLIVSRRPELTLISGEAVEQGVTTPPATARPTRSTTASTGAPR